MQNLIKHIHIALIKNNKTIAVAESCTGGLLSGMLTSLPGSSRYFILGIIAYSNRSKINTLKIPAKAIAKYGAVSENSASLMARNIRKISGADFGLGITGIAGPGGGSAAKPVGTVFIAAAGAEKTLCKKLRLRGSRADIRNYSSLQSLQLLKLIL